MNDVDKADQIAADLVAKCYGRAGVLACVIRVEGDQVRLIAPVDNYKALALMLYLAADEVAARAPAVPNG